MADDRREFSLLTEWLQTLPDFHFHNPQTHANSFTVPMERGAVENGWEGGAGLQACLGTRFLPLTCFWPKGKKKKWKPTHSPFSLPRQMWGPGRHSSVEMVSRKPLQNLFLGVGVRVCNYICLAEVNQGLCNTVNEEHSFSVAIWKLDMTQYQQNLLQRSAVQRISASTEDLSYVGNQEDLTSFPTWTW